MIEPVRLFTPEHIEAVGIPVYRIVAPKSPMRLINAKGSLACVNGGQ
jgi:hypothetical protein